MIINKFCATMHVHEILSKYKSLLLLCVLVCVLCWVLIVGMPCGGVRVDMSAKDLLSPIPSSQDWAHGVPA